MPIDLSSLHSPLSYIFSNSPLEKLPLELVSGILEYAPECVLKVRAASHAMRWHVAEYSLKNTTIPIVRDLRFYYSTKQVYVVVTVPDAATDLFELRLIGNWSLFSQTKRVTNKCEETTNYYIHFTKAHEGGVLEHFSDCIGRSFEKVDIEDHGRSFEKTEGYRSTIFFYSTITKLLDGKEFGHLITNFETLSYLAINELLRPLKDCTTQITLSVRNVMPSNPERFLLDLSTFFRSIRITQLFISKLEKGSRFFFGHRDVDWSPIILQMFSGKMDTLYISNFHYPQYLSRESATTLLEGLTLSQKRLWFTATTCNVMKTTATNDDFLTEADGHYLKIIHRSRQDE